MNGYKNGQTSVVLRVKLLDSSSTTGAGLTGLTSASSGLIISTIADNEASATAYTVAGSTIESITTLGTYAAPTATKVRFKEVDATNHKGIYEIQLADARFAVNDAKKLLLSISGATNLAQADYEIPIVQLDPYGSSNAQTFASLTITGALTVSDGINVAAATTNRPALQIAGNGTGEAIICNGGATANAVTFTAGASGNGAGFSIAGHGSGRGIVVAGGATGIGMLISGGSTSGNAVQFDVTSGIGFNIAGGGANPGMRITGGATGSGLHIQGGGTSGSAIAIETVEGHGVLIDAVGTSFDGIHVTSDAGKAVSLNADGDALNCNGSVVFGSLFSIAGQVTMADGIAVTVATSNRSAFTLAGNGTGSGFVATGGATGIGGKFIGGGTSGTALALTTTSGDGFSITPTAGNAIVATANGTSKHGFVITGGTAGTSDGLKAVAGTGGVPIRGDITGTITTVGQIATGGIDNDSIADGTISSSKFSVGAVAGVETGILEQIVQLWRWFFRKTEYDSVNETIKTFADDETTVLTTADATNSAGVETKGNAT